MLAGKLLLGFGALVVAFIAYQLWGTGLVESHSQAVLRAELRQELAHTRAPGRTVASGASGHTSAPGRDVVGGAGAAAGTEGPPVPTGTAVAIIQIPSIGVDKAVVQGVGETSLQEGPGHYPGTPLPGQPGNAAIAGHRTTFGGPFYRLNALRPGDSIDVTTTAGSFRYLVARSFVVLPSDVSVVAPTSGNILTLTTCTPRFSAAERLVVQARLAGRTKASPGWVTAAATGGATAKGQPGSATASLRAGSSSAAAPWIDGVVNLGGLLGRSHLLAAVAWGALLAIVAWGALAASRALHSRLAWLAGVPLVAVTLFVFFASISPLLPANL
ncbi:MAG: sortase [Actinomycetota bacterium]|nr:sortase [Actinomycetota bacterium]